jgi:RimJ/RimL family protein N-acetyltransferase
LSDVASLAENANNINVWNNVRDYFPHPYSEADGRRFIEMAFSDFQPVTEMAVVVNGKAVGGIGILPKSDVKRITAEIGYWLGENYWNRGIMTEAIREMTTHAFTRFPLHKLYAPVFAFNAASQRALQKAGFEREAILKQAAIKNGKIIDLHYYSLLKSQWLKSTRIRSFRDDDRPVLKDLLYEAVLQSNDSPLPRDIVEKPEMAVYIRDFGTQKDDFCLLAELNGKVTGGIWIRILAGAVKGYGHVDTETPELVVSLFRAYRKQGIGTQLMRKMIEHVREKGYKQVSLSVQKANDAVRMYRKCGFEVVRENEADYIMVLKLT